jgi:hypothetical protein
MPYNRITEFLHEQINRRVFNRMGQRLACVVGPDKKIDRLFFVPYKPGAAHTSVIEL